MDLIVFIFLVFITLGLILAVLVAIGIVVEYALKKEEDDFDDVEGIKRVFKEEDKL